MAAFATLVVVSLLVVVALLIGAGQAALALLQPDRGQGPVWRASAGLGSATSASSASPSPGSPSAAPATGSPSTPPATGSPLLGNVLGMRPPIIRSSAGGIFPGGLLIADRGNGRLIVVTEAGRVAWSFPGPGGLPAGQRFAADDAFVAPDGLTIVANDESHQVIDRIDIRTGRVVWQFGVYNHAGADGRHVHTPDDAYPLANGNVVVADIRNCRVIEINPARRIVRQWGRTGICVDHPPQTYAQPNGDTPLPDGGLLITEITGSRVVRLAPDGHVVFDIHVPARYPSDAQLAPDGSIVVADYSSRGAVLRLSQRGALLWRFAAAVGARRLDHPSLAVPLGGGLIVLNDDFRHRVVVIDPRGRIVWQYGVTGVPGRGPGLLNIPDGVDVLPPGVIPLGS